MPKPAPASNSRRPRSHRSVAGCLTCRRRKVKCASKSIPCQPCRRLNLLCESSFHQNFKAWTTERGGREETTDRGRSSASSSPIVLGRGPTYQGESISATSRDAEEEANQHQTPEGAAETSEEETVQRDTTETDDSFSLLDFIFSDLATEITPFDLSTPASSDAFFSVDWLPQRAPTLRANGVGDASSSAMVPISASVGSPVKTPHDASSRTATGPLQNQPLDPTVSQAMYRVPEFLSTKQSIYTCFHYLVNSARAIPNSPLCHAILGWVYAYLARVHAGSSSSRVEHYTTASNAIRILSQELSGGSASQQPTWRGTNGPDQLSLYASSTFFVCQHDLMMGNLETFMDRMRDVKLIFQHQWSQRIIPGPVESRIVIWLAFMELRLLFGREKTANSDSEKDFMTILAESGALPALRQARTHKSILSEMFPNGLPREEDEEDLRKDRLRVKFDDLMCYLAKVRRFGAWDASQRQRSGVDAELLHELREAKVEALRADLGRLQAECELAVPPPKTWPPINKAIDSITFHKLTVDTLRGCATIIFKRAIPSTPRNDPECQAAVADIVRIARLFRQTKYLRSSRSTIWPLQLFIAGIETTDGVYQDWIIDYMKELGSWGAHIQMSAEALERIVTWQEKTGERVAI